MNYFNYRDYHTHRISEVKCSLDEIIDLINWRKVHQMLHTYSIVTLDYCGGSGRESEGRVFMTFLASIYMYM